MGTTADMKCQMPCRVGEKVEGFRTMMAMRSLHGFKPRRKKIWVLLAAALAAAASLSCRSERRMEAVPLSVPRGYLATLQVNQGGRNLRFGPFVGYYFRPETPGNLERLDFICFNERSFYTTDLPANTALFEGQAVLTTLPDAAFALPAEARINPVFFEDAPAAWIQSPPRPAEAYRHFHSCYSGAGPSRTGYWLRHVALARFTYDMGGRVGPESPLYHEVQPGVDTGFARIIEFDRGPSR